MIRGKSSKMFSSMTSTSCSRSNQAAVISAEMWVSKSIRMKPDGEEDGKIVEHFSQNHSVGPSMVLAQRSRAHTPRNLELVAQILPGAELFSSSLSLFLLCFTRGSALNQTTQRGASLSVL